MQFILEVAAASAEDALATELHAFFEPKSDLSSTKKDRTEMSSLAL